MQYIKLKHSDGIMKVEVDGDAHTLTKMVAAAMTHDPHFAKIVIAALTIIAEEDPINEINLN